MKLCYTIILWVRISQLPHDDFKIFFSTVGCFNFVFLVKNNAGSFLGSEPATFRIKSLCH